MSILSSDDSADDILDHSFPACYDQGILGSMLKVNVLNKWTAWLPNHYRLQSHCCRRRTFTLSNQESEMSIHDSEDHQARTRQEILSLSKPFEQRSVGPELCDWPIRPKHELDIVRLITRNAEEICRKAISQPRDPTFANICFFAKWH